MSLVTAGAGPQKTDTIGQYAARRGRLCTGLRYKTTSDALQ